MTSIEASTSANAGLSRPLAEIAAEINRHHRIAVGHVNNAVTQAKLIGDLLTQAKSQVSRGEWIDWLETNCDVSVRQAQRYLLLAKKWDGLPDQDVASHLTIDGALSQIAESQPQKRKNDAASYLAGAAESRNADIATRLANLPADVVLHAKAKHGWAEIYRSEDPAMQNRWHLGICNLSASDGTSYTYNERPMLPELVKYALQSRLMLNVEFRELRGGGAGQLMMMVMEHRPSERAKWHEVVEIGFDGVPKI
jgi:hypothetical protein